jgi:hypothetical protein
MTTWLQEISRWWAGVSPEWSLLFALPFLVAALGLWADHRRRPTLPASTSSQAGPPKARPSARSAEDSAPS